MREGIVTRYNNDLVAWSFDKNSVEGDKSVKDILVKNGLRPIKRGYCEWIPYYIYSRIFGVKYFVNTDEQETVGLVSSSLRKQVMHLKGLVIPRKTGCYK